MKAKIEKLEKTVNEYEEKELKAQERKNQHDRERKRRREEIGKGDSL